MRYQEDLEKEAEKTGKRREKKKRRQVKVSGRGVFKLRELISKKSRD